MEGTFYQSTVRQKDWLRFYVTQFPTTELNGVLPTPQAVKDWRDPTPDDFVFAWKTSKFITHWKRHSDRSANSLDLLESRISLLWHKAGPILFQLPPQFEINYDRLAMFLKMLRRERRYAFEFRHPSWYVPRVFHLLAGENISLCLSDHHDAPSPWKRTANFVYVRGHGPGGRYKNHYSAATLESWAQQIKSWK